MVYKLELFVRKVTFLLFNTFLILIYGYGLKLYESRFSNLLWIDKLYFWHLYLLFKTKNNFFNYFTNCWMRKYHLLHFFKSHFLFNSHSSSKYYFTAWVAQHMNTNYFTILFTYNNFTYSATIFIFCYKTPSIRHW